MKRLVLAMLGSAAPAMAWAGPPYFTDDPEPTDLGHWEIYAFAAGTQTLGSFDGVTGLDLNYGALPDVQLTATLPFDFSDSPGSRLAYGDTEIGVKYRFFNREKAGFAIAAFPRVILPTSPQHGQQGRVRLLLPVWAQKDICKWSVFGGGGYLINPGAGNRSYWQSGLAVTRTLSERLSLGAEIAHRGPDAIGARSYTALNFGGIYRLGGPFALLFSGGPGIANRDEGGQTNVYVALAANF